MTVVILMEKNKLNKQTFGIVRTQTCLTFSSYFTVFVVGKKFFLSFDICTDIFDNFHLHKEMHWVLTKKS